MRNCTTCGNEISEDAYKCPYCETLQDRWREYSPAESRKLAEINLKSGMPTVAKALEHLEFEIGRRKGQGYRVARVVHGYGSSGVGGAIRHAVIKRLHSQKAKGSIRRFINGEDYDSIKGRARSWHKSYPFLRDSWAQDRRNPGITLVEL